MPFVCCLDQPDKAPIPPVHPCDVEQPVGPPYLLLSLFSALCLQPANALTFNELQGLTYLEVKGTGVANTCPQLQSGSSNLNVSL